MLTIKLINKYGDDHDEVSCDVVSDAASVIVVILLLQLQNLLLLNRPTLLCSLRPGINKHYHDVTHKSSHPLFARQASGWGGTMTCA